MGAKVRIASCFWISGWGIEPGALAPVARQLLPGCDHEFHPPTRAAAVAGANSGRTIVAWSLGALMVIDAAADRIEFKGDVFLLAPFLAFCSEFKLGGRCSLTQVRWLKRWVQRDPRAALQDFYERAGIRGFDAPDQLSTGEMSAGLERLAEPAAPGAVDLFSGGLPRGWLAAVGASDPLLDGETVASTLRGCDLIQAAGHAPLDLLKALLDRLT